MIRTAELTVYYSHGPARVWEAITGGDAAGLKVMPLTPEQAEEVKPELGKAVCQVTELDPMNRCAMRMHGPGFVTDWSAELSAAENNSTKVTYRQSIDFAAKRLYVMAPLIMNPRTQLKSFAAEIKRKLAATK